MKCRSKISQKKLFSDKKCFPRNTWFDNDWKELKACGHEAHKAWRAEILNTQLRSIYFEVNRELQRLIMGKRAAQSQAHELNSMRYYNPKAFWKCLRKDKGSIDKSISMANLKHHFRTLHYKDLDYDDVPSVAEVYMYMHFDMPIYLSRWGNVSNFQYQELNIPWDWWYASWNP